MNSRQQISVQEVKSAGWQQYRGETRMAEQKVVGETSRAMFAVACKL